MEELKKIAGVTAAKYVEDGMVVGLGTGSTAYFFVEEIGRRIKEEGLTVVGVTTSSQTTKQAEGLGIPLKAVDDIDSIDVTVDGADEVDPQLNGIKGGGGALLWEKIVADISKHYMWIVDESKMVHQLGAFPLPVEVIPFGAQHVFNKLAAKGYQPTWRMDGDQRYRTDENDYIIDLHLGKIDDPQAMAEELIHMVGVVEHGLFLNRVNDVIVGRQNGPEILHAR